MLRLHRLFPLLFLFAAGACTALAASPSSAAPEAMLVIVGDQHSAYDRAAQFLARVDRLRARHPGVPFAVLINGDSLEHGNVVARRTAGAIDFALLRALAERVPTVINLGNHEPEFHDVPETVARLTATGARVVGNLRDRATGKLFAPAALRLPLGRHEAVIAGLTTDRLNTYRVAIRPQLDLADPVVWARERFPALFADASQRAANAPDGAATLPIVLSHAGLRADRAILPFAPKGTLFAGAHDHLRFVHAAERGIVYFHSGSWMDFVSIARLHRTARGLEWQVEQQTLHAHDPADPALAALVRETLQRHLTAEETAIVGRTPRALSPAEAARFAVEAARRAARADLALVGATTFGAGLPAGDVTRYAFDACVRFDGPLHVGELTGEQAQALLARANQGPDTPFEQRSGENLIVAAANDPVAGRNYRFVTTDWVAKNARMYLGENPPALAAHPHLALKAAVLEALSRQE